MDVNETCGGDHFTIYTYIQSLGCIPKTYTMLHINCTSILKTLCEKTKYFKCEENKHKDCHMKKTSHLFCGAQWNGKRRKSSKGLILYNI